MKSNRFTDHARACGPCAGLPATKWWSPCPSGRLASAEPLLLACSIRIRVNRGIQTRNQIASQFGALAIWQRKGLLKECFCVVGHLNHYTVRYFLSASILSRPRWYQAHIHRLKLELRLIRVGSEICFRCFQPVLVIALGEVGFVMCAARFVPHARALGNHS